MSHRTSKQRRTWKERAISLLLAAALVAGLVPGLTLPAAAEHWADTYLDQLVDWGVLRADQTANPDADLTRAEFMAIINRAYGYTETGPIPFEDVLPSDWFYDDVSIAYTAGYMAGTSDITASPNETLTREQAVCILGRNMMMEATPGESLAFSDSRNVSDWARGTIKTAVENSIVSGYPDNTFHPLSAISKAQMAVLITQCVGTPVRQSGTYEMGGVFGNVTITAPNVTLRNTTISGDLYVSGGVGLGGIKLENVNVLGRIIVSGTGESEAGDASVVMRNVSAESMLVDNMRNKTVTIRADGITDIAKTIVRTSAYLEDNNTDDKGLMSIELDGESGTRLTLAGRIKEVVDKTPNSYVQVAKGTVATLTVDEAAVNSTIQLDRNTEVKVMNLDVATNVTGEGDIGQLNVNAPGSVVAMLPDKIYIRPGLTANIAGVIMDYQAAEEGSLDPRLLSGYPAAKDISPTGLRADFAGNKKGTIYWAVSNITDGSIGEEELITPPTYGSKALRNGSVAEPNGGSEVSAQITGLTVGGSYYLSAILVDDQGNRSPVKVVSFTTPDNSIPAFGQGYPYMSFVGKESPYDARITAQVTVLPTKDCRMYYAVLQQGATVPTANELKSAAVSGNLGYGVVDLTKNLEEPFVVSRQLEELKDYVLYLWLTDIDGTNSSAVIPLAFRTPDVTAPEFVVHPHLNGQAQATSVPLAATLNENGTIYWVVVESGTAYPKPNRNDPTGEGNSEDGQTALLTSDYAKLQVVNGMNALRSGRVNATANTEVAINITGLQAEQSYDLYYMAQDTAGNYTIQVYKLEGGIRTLDTNPPTIRQFFTKFDGQDNTQNPMRDTDIVLEFSENVVFTQHSGRDLVSLYQATQEGSTTEREEALDRYVTALKSSITFKVWVFGLPQDAKVKGDLGVDDDWVIDYEKTTVSNVNGAIRLTFLAEGLQLDSGGIYHFEITNLEDTSGHAITPTTVNYEQPSVAAGHNVPMFTVVFARVRLTDSFLLPDSQVPQAIVDANKASSGIGEYQVDFKFRMMPDSTETVADGIAYDLLIWTDTAMEFELYYRAVTASGRVLTATWDEETSTYPYGMPNMDRKLYTLDQGGWITLGRSGGYAPSTAETGEPVPGKSLHYTFNGCTQSTSAFPALNKLKAQTDDGEDIYYDFAISIREMGTSSSTAGNPSTWSGDVNVYVDVAAGTSSGLYNLSSSPQITTAQWNRFLTNGLNSSNGGESIGSTSNPDDSKRLHMYRYYTDSVQPSFADNFPTFKTTDTSVTMNLTLDRPGTVYYVIGYADLDGTELPNEVWTPSIRTYTYGNAVIDQRDVPSNGSERVTLGMPKLIEPDGRNIQNPVGWAPGNAIVPPGNLVYQGVTNATVDINNLEPNRTYYVYFVITGNGSTASDVEIYKFKTDEVSRPVITLNSFSSSGSGGVNMRTDMNSYLTYILYPENEFGKIDWMNAPLTSVLNPAYAGQLPAGYQSYTILQALTMPYDYYTATQNGTNTSGYLPTGDGNDPTRAKAYSVFDVYASESAKKSVMTWLTEGNLPAEIYQGAQPGPAQKEENIRMTQNVNRPGGTEARPGSPYYIITMARSTNSNEEDGAEIYSFRALWFEIADQNPPELISASVSNIRVDSGSGNLRGGTITLTFDKKLHKEDRSPYSDGENGAHEIFGTDWPAGMSSASVSHNGDTTTITITLKAGEPANVTFMIPYNSLYNAGGVPAQKTLEVVIGKVTNSGTDTNLGVSRYFWVIYWGQDANNQPIPFRGPTEFDAE